MKCKNKEFYVKGAVYNDASGSLRVCTFRVLCTNDKKGKTLSIDNGLLQFTIPFEAVEEYFKGDYKK